MKLLLALPLLAAASCSVIPSISATPRFGALDVDGDIAVTSAVATASSDANTLGLDDDTVLSPRVDASWGAFDLMLSSFSAEYSGRGVAEAQIDLGGIIINAGDIVDSKLDLDVVSGIITVDLIPTSFIDVGIGLGASAIDFSALITSVNSGGEVSANEDFVIPVVALRVGTQLGPIEVNVHASGLSGKYEDIDATFLDLDVYAEYSFEEFLGFYAAFVVGYRHIGLDVEYTDSGSDIDADLTFSGVYVGLTAGI